MPWQALSEVIEPDYPKAGNGRPPVDSKHSRMYFIQHWFHLADEACEEALLDSNCVAAFSSVSRSGARSCPDGTTLLKIRRRLEGHQLAQKLFATVG